MIDVITCFYSSHESKDHRSNDHEGDVEQTQESSDSASHSFSTIDRPPHSIDCIDLTTNLDTFISVKEAESSNALRFIKSIKLITSFRIIKESRSFTFKTCLFCYNNPQRGRTSTLTRNDSLRRHCRQIHFQYQIDPFRVHYHLV